jgi:protein-S-isoprenylcysteine O-methyltransferase Ste14
MAVHRFITIPWIIFVVYWVISAFYTRRTESKESASSRYQVMILVWLGYTLIFFEKVRIGFLDERVVPPSSYLATAGLALTWIGIGLALWARWHLGANWSGRVTIKQGHELIRTGPYARLRHPIYSGLDLATIGTGMVFDRWGCVIGFALVITGYWIKARKEEAMLAARFSDSFREHCQQTGFLFPKLG